MDQQTFLSFSAKETALFAKELAFRISPGDILCLKGDLGAGKTTFVQAFAEGLGLSSKLVTSPTFTYLNLIETFAHFDLYRIPSLEHFVSMGFDEYLEDPFITCIEWPDIIKPLLPEQTLWIELFHQGENKRKITLFSHQKLGAL